jgi:hypothetical protein
LGFRIFGDQEQDTEDQAVASAASAAGKRIEIVVPMVKHANECHLRDPGD